MGLAGTIGTRLGIGVIRETDATLMMLPPPVDLIARMAYVVPRNTPPRFTLRALSQSSRVVSAIGLAKDTPALLTSTFSR
jgi:hypothetical protein